MNHMQHSPQNPILLIPARMKSQRLPGKPLADIHGQPMIAHVWRIAKATALGRVVVAAAEQEIVDAVLKAGGEAVLTDPGLPSGSDRIHAALKLLDPDKKHDAVINVQGDVPTLDPRDICTAYALLQNPQVAIATLVALITPDRKEEIEARQVVKAAVEIKPGEKNGRALYFSRAPIPADGPYYHHIGIYAYRREALEAFVNAPPSTLEQGESLEQLRGLAMGLRIDAALVDAIPLGVDTPADLARACELLKPPAS